MSKLIEKLGRLIEKFGLNEVEESFNILKNEWAIAENPEWHKVHKISKTGRFKETDKGQLVPDEGVGNE